MLISLQRQKEMNMLFSYTIT